MCLSVCLFANKHEKMTQFLLSVMVVVVTVMLEKK